MKKRGRPAKNQNTDQMTHVTIDFSQITKLKNLNVDARMMEQMESGTVLDLLISHEGGMPCASNMMCVGDPGVGKTTVLLDFLAMTQLKNPTRKCLFISGEMGKKQMFKYTQRYPQFGYVDTLFVSDFAQHNAKYMVEQVMNLGWDLVLIDSVAEVIDDVRTDMGWDRKTAESWLVDVCTQNNKGNNKENKYTSFLLIQQVTKAGVFVGSNKLKHLTDGMVEMRREKESDGGGTYMEFTKNRNGSVGEKLYFQLTGTQIVFSELREKVED
jgi:predicted ATP-dependent serine protease